MIIYQLENKKMLYTSSLSFVEKTSKKKMKPCFIMENRGNDVVVPDRLDLDQCRRGAMTWEGFRANYLTKLMTPEAEEWMRRIASESVNEDVVLISEEDARNCYRVLLAERIMNMFSGQMRLRYVGEMHEDGSLSQDVLPMGQACTHLELQGP